MTEHAARDLFNRIATELALPTHWRLHFDRANRRFGQCDYRKHQINLSRPLVHLNESKTVEATIRHEIAHALVGPGHHHDEVWRRMAIRCGDDGRRCYGSDVLTPESRYVAFCPKCKQKHQMYRLRKSKHFGIRQYSCAKCSNGRFNPAYLLVYGTNVSEVSSTLIMMNQTTLRAGLVVRYNDTLYRVDHCNESRARIVPISLKQMKAESFDGDDRGGVNISASACVDIIEDIAKAADELELAKEEAELARLKRALAAEQQAPAAVINIVPAASGRAARGGGWQRSKAAAPTFRPGSLAAAVLSFVVASPGLTAAQIADAMGGNAGSVKAFVSRFFHDGLIEPSR